VFPYNLRCNPPRTELILEVTGTVELRGSEAQVPTLQRSARGVDFRPHPCSGANRRYLPFNLLSLACSPSHCGGLQAPHFTHHNMCAVTQLSPLISMRFDAAFSPKSCSLSTLTGTKQKRNYCASLSSTTKENEREHQKFRSDILAMTAAFPG
jgi:hypothetical protein